MGKNLESKSEDNLLVKAGKKLLPLVFIMGLAGFNIGCKTLQAENSGSEKSPEISFDYKEKAREIKKYYFNNENKKEGYCICYNLNNEKNWEVVEIYGTEENPLYYMFGKITVCETKKGAQIGFTRDSIKLSDKEYLDGLNGNETIVD